MTVLGYYELSCFVVAFEYVSRGKSHILQHSTTIFSPRGLVVKNRYVSPPSLILNFFLISATLIGKFRTVIFAFFISSFCNSFLLKGMVFTTLNLLPGKSNN